MEGSDGKIEANMTTCCSKLDKIAYNCKLIYRVVNLRMIFAVYIILDCNLVFTDKFYITFKNMIEICFTQIQIYVFPFETFVLLGHIVISI